MVIALSELRKYISNHLIVSFDIETAPDPAWRDDPKAALDPHKAHIVGASFSVAEGDAIYVPVAHITSATNIDWEAFKKFLANFASDPTIVKAAHNLAFESTFLYHLGIILQAPLYDTIAASLLTPKAPHTFRGLSESGLKTLVPALLKTSLPSFDEVTAGRHFDELDPTDPGTIRYACADADYALRLYHLFNNWFDRHMPKHRYIVKEIESPTAVYCGVMKHNGLLVDQVRMKEAGERCGRERDRIREEIAGYIGAVDIGSNANNITLKKYLFNTLGLPVLKSTGSRAEAFDDEALILLSEWCSKNRPELAPLFGLIQDYRRWGKIKSTYINGYLKYINPATGRIHADLLPLATETGRFAARNPNLQNAPRIDNDPAGVRNFFKAADGNVLLSLDFSQIELRVGAFYCRDARMLETYRTGGDIHAMTTAVVYHIPLEEAKDKNAPQYKSKRTIAKNTNFGMAFGIFPKGLQRTLKFKAGLDTSLQECTRIIANLKKGYPALVRWQEKMKARAHERRYVETWLGRRRYLPDVNSDDWGKQAFSERAALNSPIQGTAADILKLALGRIIKGLPTRPWLKPLLQIHDELVFEIPTDRLEDAIQFVKSCMEARPFQEFDVPIVAESSHGKRFGEMKD
jgi:DNA polymerase-1